MFLPYPCGPAQLVCLGSLKFQGRGEHNENIIQTQIKLASNSRVMLDYRKNNFLSQRWVDVLVQTYPVYSLFTVGCFCNVTLKMYYCYWHMLPQEPKNTDTMIK